MSFITSLPLRVCSGIPLLVACLAVVPIHPSIAQEQGTGWRFQAAGDYFSAKSTYDFSGDLAGFDGDGDLDGDFYGGTVSIGFPKWKKSSWLDLAYRQGSLDGDYTYTGFSPFGGQTQVSTDIDEFMIRYRSSLWKTSFGISFNYQNWDTEERRVGVFRYDYDHQFYLVNFDLGWAWHKAFNNGIDVGAKLDIGFGPGYAATSKFASEDGFLADAYGGGSVFLQYVVFQKRTTGTIFVEGGYKGVLYWTYRSENELDQSELWTQYGPFVRAGMRFEF